MNINLDQFSDNVRSLYKLMNSCTLCPRNCKVNRTAGRIGFCGISDTPLVSSAGPHFGEESVLIGKGGSGTIFFAGCNLGCIFCQNFDISHQHCGSELSVEQLADAMLNLQRIGCININFVTPTHVIAPIIAAIELAKARPKHSRRDKGLTLPTVYNTGGYDSLETLKLIEGYIDIYMPDMKYADPDAAKQLSDSPDYPQVNFAAIKEMHRQVGDLKIKKGIATQGLLIRHLVLPNQLAGSFKIIDFLTNEISPNTAINVMDQYQPCYKANLNPQINRRPTTKEVSDVENYAAKKGLRIIR